MNPLNAKLSPDPFVKPRPPVNLKTRIKEELGGFVRRRSRSRESAGKPVNGDSTKLNVPNVDKALDSAGGSQRDSNSDMRTDRYKKFAFGSPPMNS